MSMRVRTGGPDRTMSRSLYPKLFERWIISLGTKCWKIISSPAALASGPLSPKGLVSTDRPLWLGRLTLFLPSSEPLLDLLTDLSEGRGCVRSDDRQSENPEWDIV